MPFAVLLRLCRLGCRLGCLGMLLFFIVLGQVRTAAASDALPVFPAPAGYVEVSPEANAEFFSALDSELVFLRAELLRFFAKKEEEKYVSSGDFDALTSTVFLVRFVESAEGDNSGEASTDLPQDKQVKQEEEIDREFFNSKLAPAFMLRNYAYSSGPSAEEEPQAVRETSVAEWLAKEPKKDGETLDLGLLERHANYRLFAWLQEQNEVVSYGMTTAGQVSVVFAKAKPEQGNLGLVFTQRVVSAADAERSRERASRYVRENAAHLVADKKGAVIPSGNILPVLKYAASLWSSRGQYEKALDAYTRLFPVWEACGVQRMLIGAVNLNACRLDMKYYKEVIKTLPSLIEKSEKSIGSDDPLLIALREILGAAYLGEERLSEAKDTLEEALAAAHRTFGAVHTHVLNLAKELAALYVVMGNMEESVILYKDVLLQCIEFNRLEIAVLSFFNIMMHAKAAGNMPDFWFYLKLIGSLACYNQHSSENILQEYNDLPFRIFVENFSIVEQVVRDEDEFAEIWNRPNSPEDTPFNKLRSLMRGSEIALYQQYGLAASALQKAGQSGSEEDKQKARADFRNWLDSVQPALGSGQPDFTQMRGILEELTEEDDPQESEAEQQRKEKIEEFARRAREAWQRDK